MITVIIAGGSGTRLWPLSTHEYPKQLLTLTNDRSLVQNTYDRVKQFTNDIYFVPEIRLLDPIKKQLPEIPDANFIFEPALKGTANCFVAALDKLIRHHDEDEVVAFLHADHHIRDARGFKHTFLDAQEVAEKTDKVVLVGIEPTYASTGLGYIEKSKPLNEDLDYVYGVKSFKEKPDYNTANEYFLSGDYLWNCGYFVGSIKTFINSFKTYSPELYENFEKLQKIQEDDLETYKKVYSAFDNLIIDYAYSEKAAEDLLVIPATFDWMDMGSFKDVHDATVRDELGNHYHGENIYTVEVENAYVRNEDGRPIAIIGLDNVVVVNTDNGILVARKDLSQKVGEIAKKVQN